MSSEDDLREKLRKIETLFAGAGTEGQRNAAEAALYRIRERLTQSLATSRPVEFKICLSNRWSRQLFSALCRRYDLKPYRYVRQRSTMVMVKAPEEFINGVLWPEYQALETVLSEHISAVVEKIIREEVHSDTSDTAEVAETWLIG